MRPASTAFALLLAAGATLAACGGAVTDPLDEAGLVPSAALGTWHLVDEDGCADPAHVLVIERGAGTVFGHFSFPLWSRQWQLFFADAPWNGSGFVFEDPETFGLNMTRMTWTGTYTAERAFGNPADPEVVPEHVTLSGIRPLAYNRPGVHRSRCPAD